MFNDASAAGTTLFPVHQLCQQLQRGGGALADADGRIAIVANKEVGKVVDRLPLPAVAEVELFCKGDGMTFFTTVQQLVHLAWLQQEEHIILQLIRHKIHNMLAAGLGKPDHLVMVMAVRKSGQLIFEAAQLKDIELPGKRQVLIGYVNTFV